LQGEYNIEGCNALARPVPSPAALFGRRERTRVVRGEKAMDGTRRNALKMLAGAAGIASLGALLAAGQDPSQRNPAGTSASGEPNPDPTAEPKRTKALLEQNQKDIKKNIEKLFQLASELKNEVEKTDATTVLSMTMVRKAEDIEKLAHQIKERAKG
jgi:hypothetical protein